MLFYVLIDAEGKVFYTHSGIDDDEGLEYAISSPGPEFKASLYEL